MRRPAIILALVSLVASGCAAAYSSLYKETNHKLHPAPVAAKDVRVVKSRDDLSSKWTELGVYRGHAPTTQEAMDAAKSSCGNAGANFFILNTDPFESEGKWKVDGICAALEK